MTLRRFGEAIEPPPMVGGADTSSRLGPLANTEPEPVLRTDGAPPPVPPREALRNGVRGVLFSITNYKTACLEQKGCEMVGWR